MGERKTSVEIDAAAADFAVRVGSGPLSAAEQAELDAWLGDDIHHRGAFARMQAVFLHARRAKALGADFDPDFYRSQHAARLPDATSEENRDAGGADRRRFLLWGISAAAVAASAAGALWLGLAGQGETFATVRGEVRLVPLPDGSQMTLNTASRANVRFSARERRVELSDGEALFDVAKDPTRPFYVVAGDIQVRAVGTSFTVKRLTDRPVQVLVREGIVKVRSSVRASARTVGANSIATELESGAIRTAPISPGHIGRQLAWREGMLSFEDESLNRAVREFARYSDHRILFADPALGAETVTGLFAANNPEGFATVVATSLGLRAETVPNGIVLKR